MPATASHGSVATKTVAGSGAEEFHQEKADCMSVFRVPASSSVLATLHSNDIWGSSPQSVVRHRAERGEEWREGSGEAVSGVLYKAADGSERIARADLSIICDGMYSSLRSKLSTPRIRCLTPFKLNFSSLSLQPVHPCSALHAPDATSTAATCINGDTA